MDFEETMDNQEVEESLPEEIVEEADDTEEDLEEFVDDSSEESEQSDEQPEEPKATAKKEPGYVRDRIDKAVQKALTQERDTIRESLRAEMEAQYAPIRDRLLEMDAKELVRQGEFKSIERAKEYLQLKQGITPTQKEPQPRNEQGRFASREEQAEYNRTQGRINELQRQADKIKEKQGLDVIAEYNRNEKVRKAIINGEMDFYDVAESMKPKKRPPSPTRSPNGVNGVGPQSITSMSDAQFKKMDKMLDEGVRFTIRR